MKATLKNGEKVNINRNYLNEVKKALGGDNLISKLISFASCFICNKFKKSEMIYITTPIQTSNKND